jgi:CBS domain-containing protein
MSKHCANTIARVLKTDNRAISSYNIYKHMTIGGLEYKVSEEDTLIHALMRFSLIGTSTLAVTNRNDDIIGIFSQDMYMRNISWLEGKSSEIYMGEILQPSNHDSIAFTDTKLISCYNKIQRYNISDLLVLDKNDTKNFGIVSSNDIIHKIINSIH